MRAVSTAMFCALVLTPLLTRCPFGPLFSVSVIEVDGVEELRGLLVGPVRSEPHKLEDHLGVQEHKHHHWHVGHHAVPLPIGHQEHVALDDGTHVEEVDEEELVALPKGGVGHLGLEEHPAQAREGRGHLQHHPLDAEEVSDLVVETHRTATDQAQPVVSEEGGVERVEHDVRDGEGGHLEDEEANDDGGREEAGLRRRFHHVLAERGIHYPVPTRKYHDDGSERGSNDGEAPEDLFLGLEGTKHRKVERDEVGQEERGEGYGRRAGRHDQLGLRSSSIDLPESGEQSQQRVVTCISS